MASWAQKRRIFYGGFLLIVILAFVFSVFFFFFYKQPNCFDGKQNGSEQGVDCGGACSKLCPSAFDTPQVAWTRYEEIAPHIYNISAYIINSNIDGEAKKVPYHVQLFDNEGILITEYDDSVTLPPHRNALAFRNAVDVGQRVMGKALFLFSGIPDWHKQSDTLSSLLIGDKDYREDATGSSLSVTIKNQSNNPIGKISVAVVLYDDSGNAIGFSKTYIDGIDAKGVTIAPFTWPNNRNGKVVSIEVLPVAE